MKKSYKLFGFTLAELMVVLAVLGVIAAVLVPAVFTSMPDENRLKFKKGYYTLKRTVDGMVNSKAYQNTEGMFCKDEPLANATDPASYADILAANDDGSRYFCVQFSEMLNSVQTQCDRFVYTTTESSADLVTKEFDASDIAAALDTKCAGFPADDGTAADTKVNVITQDGIYWSLPQDTFCGTAGSKRMATVPGYGSVPAYYSLICLDVDGPGGEAAFGFGIRRDGKVVAGARAKEWLKEGVKKIAPDEDDDQYIG